MNPRHCMTMVDNCQIINISNINMLLLMLTHRLFQSPMYVFRPGNTFLSEHTLVSKMEAIASFLNHLDFHRFRKDDAWKYGGLSIVRGRGIRGFSCPPPPPPKKDSPRCVYSRARHGVLIFGHDFNFTDLNLPFRLSRDHHVSKKD